MVENDRTMCRINDDGTVTVGLVRTVPMPDGPTGRDITIESDTLEIMLRHAARFMFPTAKRNRLDRSE